MTAAEDAVDRAARRLAADHVAGPQRSRQTPLLDNLEAQTAFLRQAHATFTRQAQEETILSSNAAEWVLDNFYIVQQALNLIETDMPPSYYRELPVLSAGTWDGYPRVYALARAIIAHEDARITRAPLEMFVHSYQDVQPLRTGEIWALPVMLRIGIVETLTHAVDTVLAAHALAPTDPPVSVAQLPADTLVGNCVLSLRALAAEDWKDFFEQVSLVEQTLADDPIGVYPRMDFETRDHYRKEVEALARVGNHNEVDVARMAIHLARQDVDAAPEEQDRRRHVGYYLVDEGRTRLEDELQHTPAPGIRLRRFFYRAHPAVTYVGGIGLLTLLLLALLLGYVIFADAGPLIVVLVAAVTVIPAVTFATGLVNWFITSTTAPRLLPKLSYEDGVPEDARSIVVVPTLLAAAADVAPLLSELEQHYLRNADPNIYFGLLTDFTDAPTQEQPGDAEIVRAAADGIRALNQRYPGEPFYLFHRQRLWNAQEGVWMGWERKRGKLEEFNRLLLNQGDTTYFVQVGELPRLPTIRFVITLDEDTVLPRDAAHRLIGALAHPLNCPRFAEDSGEVTAGYTLLQPRTEIKPVSAARSRFSRIFSGVSGLDLYSHAVSDIYQDLFGEGIYVGKGIYDVHALARSLEGRIPENALLSHDLFEGILGRAALVTDVVLYEEYPADYLTYAHRRHRWIRGDWQLLPWLRRRVPQRTPEPAANPLSFIDRWKVLDNLRRSLDAPATLLWLLSAWLWLPGSPLVWTFATLLFSAGTLVSSVFGALLRGVGDGFLRSLRRQFQRWIIMLAFLPYEAGIAVHAITIVIRRLFFTRRHLLQWTTAANAASIFGSSNRTFLAWRHMISAPLIALAAGAAILWVRPGAFFVALPFLIAWLISPQLAVWLSRRGERPAAPLRPADEQELRNVARSTWLYFEQFMGPVDHWLPPDHYQEDPRGQVAHRTSPTNIGLGLLSTLAAYDLGYVGMWELTLRLENSLQALDELEQYRGHLLNWYDTRTQKPLPPRYVSSVDSGNLAACFIVLRQGVLDLPNTHLPRWERWQGLVDTLAMLDTAMDDLSKTAPDAAGEIVASLKEQIFQMRTQTLDRRDHPEQWTPLLASLAEDAWPRLEASLVGLFEQHNPPPAVLHRIRIWTERARHDLFDMQRRIGALVPWLRALEDAPPVLHNTMLHSAGDTPMAQAWTELVTILPQRARVSDIVDLCDRARKPLADLRHAALHAGLSPEEIAAVHDWCDFLSTRLDEGCVAVTRLLESAQSIADRCQAWVDGMNFAFLYDKQRRVFRIGYNVDAETPDPNYYDLLASESRSTSLIAIAKGDVPQSHWLHLGRPVTHIDGWRALMSWSGTMFEYLMPILWTRQYPNTLLHQSTHAAVHAHMAFARQKKVPWGISESGYYRFDAAMNYQYRAFGAPQLGFKRGLEDDTVVAPYASLLALPLYPNAVMHNLKRLRDLGMWGDYGFYEAIDFTPSRLALGQESARVRSFMVHHQGMILLSVLNALNDDLMVRRFHADPRIQSVELLLQERIPSRDTKDEERTTEEESLQSVSRPITAQPWSVPVDTPTPQAHFLANGRYGVLLTNAGGGFSRWQQTDLTRWRADTTCDNWGTWIYVQDLENNDLWSAAVQPVIDGHTCDVTFAPHKVDFQCERQRITTHTEVTVPPGDDLEIRRVRVTNQSDEPRRLRLVSYAEIVLGQQDTDRRHPAFNKMFIQGDYAADKRTLIFTRRPRSRHEEPPFFAHAVVVEAGRDAVVHYETDREHFLGRNGRIDAPAALTNGSGLSDNAGPVLDPIASFAVEIELEPHTTATLAFLSAAGVNRADVMTSIEKYRDWAQVDRSFRLAEAQSELEMRQLEVDGDTLQRFQQLLSLLLYPSAGLRADVAQITANTLGQSGLWPYAISGDYPILLARIHGEEHLALARELLQAHTYWRNRGLMIDLVLVNEEAVGYNQELQGQLRRLLDRMNSDHWVNRRGGIFLLQRGVMSPAEQNLLATAARVVLDGDRGDLYAHLRNVLQSSPRLPAFVPARDDYDRPVLAPPERPTDLQFDNGWGGFTDQGCEYVIYRRPDDPTPAPWINVIANPEFGFLVSETGGGYSWAGNSGENRLTPWSNDPVLDRPGEALYLRDEETAAIWSPTPNPAGVETPHLIRHGAGYSLFESHSHGLDQRLRLYAVPDAPLKVIHLRLHNRWDHTRRVTATYYAEWVLGVNRDQMQQYIVPEYAQGHNALLARNPYNAEFGGRVAFLAACDEPHGLTTDRTEFLGRLGDMRRPIGLTRMGLTNTVQPTTDPCAAIQLHIDLQPGEAREIYFVLGQGADRDDALRLIERFRSGVLPSGKGEGDLTSSNRDASPFPEGSPDWHAARNFWDDFLDAVHVETPDAAMNVLLNRWLPYQNASCRVWGRSAFYQSSGAYGFRDQLQDVGALLHHAPHEARRHILRAARHQFDAGDVLHWWHPPAGRGVRTRISDDLLWLPYITAHYVHTTGDASILDEELPFRLGDPLAPEEEERYSLYELSETTASLYEHCCRALNRGSTAGRHGLPLMGAGDWNDGMNRVGIEGEGESIWLGWFLYATLDAFLPLAERKDDDLRVAAFRQKMTDLRAALHEHAWDGDWYLRAFYDDGSPLGSATNRECRIDAIAQSWSVLSGAGDPERSRQALSAMDKVLVSEEEQLIRLFTPAFDKTPRDPGYIKGYPPGIRENGGQYTHAAIWAVWSYAAVGDGDRAAELFRLLNPVLHSDTRAKAAHYRVEPYVIAADVYGVEPFTGRGGWTWYTGSGGWFYRLGTEAILGLRRQGTTLRLDPCIPREWDAYRITYRFGGATYVIDVENPDHVNSGVIELAVDGKVNADGEIPLVDDGVMHRVLVRMGNP